MLGTDKTARAYVLKAAIGHDFPPQKTMEPTLYAELLRVVGQKEALARKLIVEALNEGAEFGLKRYERDVLKASCEIGEIYDEIGILWRQDVQGNPGNAEALTLNLTDQYTVIVGSPDKGYKQVPWSEQYPQQIRTISARWRQLSQQLTSYQHEPEAQALGEYFGIYADAFEAKTKSGQYSTKEVAEMWLDVDRAWMHIKGRLQPVATREYGYYDPMRIRVFPDFRLIVVTDTSGEELTSTRSAMTKVMEDRYGNFRVYRETVNALDRVEVYPGADVVFAGSLDFQPAGQSLPNEQIVQDELGTKVMLNPDSTAHRWQLAKQLAHRVFSDSKDRNLFDTVDPLIDMTVRYVGGHEYGEPLFQPPSVHESLVEDTTTLLNEDLANLCATLTIRQRISTKELSDDDAIRHAISLLGTYFRLIDVGRGAEHLQPYYIGHSLQGLRRMIKTGFIRQNETGEWHIDTSKMYDLFSENVKDLDQLVYICDTNNKQAADEYLTQAQETPAIRNIIARVKPDSVFA